MRSRWSDDEAAGFVARYCAEWGEPLALRTYSARLLGAEPGLVLHGGGNCSVKSAWTNVLGEDVDAIFVKASGGDMAVLEPEGLPGLDLGYLRRLRALPALSDGAMVDQLRTHLFRADSPTPSIEALVHAFLPATFIDHTHADAILLLTNREGGEAAVAEALGPDVIVIPYVTPGFELALAAATALEAQPEARAMVWAHHGIVTWGETARASYEAMIELVTRAEEWAAARRAARARTGVAGARSATPSKPAAPPRRGAASCEDVSPQPRPVSGRLPAEIIPVVRGLLAGRSGDADRPYDRVVIQVLDDPDILEALLAPGAREALVTPPLTTDHLIRTKSLPLWIDALRYDGPAHPAERTAAAVEAYCEEYEGYLARHSGDLPEGVETFDPRPRVVMIPGLGVMCAGPDLQQAVITRDITKHTIAVKAALAAEGTAYLGLPEDELFRMEYRTLQHAKLQKYPAAIGAPAAGSSASAPSAAAASGEAPLRGEVALITGAAGAIGTGICEGLLWTGALVAATDLAGVPLDTLVENLGAAFPGRIIGVPLDVTDPESVAAAFGQVLHTWGGVDLVIPNAGIAAVSPLTELDLDHFRLLEKVNVEGTLLVLAEAARLFRRQGTGGDIVLVSTKNVFAPGANFGAYSSTKAAAHQLARIASLEFAGDDVRVNMVAPDAVFGHGTRRSGLWAEVGPDRMKARGLDEAGLEAYYQSRNLLKAQVTSMHVANAVLFFATRQTPTTGATIPVDGGLPDSTPR
jgi:rhamnose utilization protein RhaD (predicted bifunctional aldolase and dehydrogenase)/NAD(P)-dependent dehydrogenase (short-subunit alcohol dehydrogenase family)